ncbi:hypothetical protein J6590_014108 [Homalodisca vitripennis]|nr:hypothetical protein J6590_014108 [Homalodisca vitripennis]
MICISFLSTVQNRFEKCPPGERSAICRDLPGHFCEKSSTARTYTQLAVRIADDRPTNSDGRPD